MERGRSKPKRSVWLLFVNIAIVAAMVITLAIYMNSNAREEESEGRTAMLKSTANVSDLVQLYFISQHRNLYNHHCYITPQSGDKLSYNDALEYLRKANADATVNYQVIDPDDYCGVSLIDGDTVSVDYTYDTYATIRDACDIVASDMIDYEDISATASFANSSNGAAASIALYTDITVNAGGKDKRYALLAVIETKNIAYSGLPNLAYQDAGACIIDQNGDYIVKDDIRFRNSDNFFKFLRVYNSLTFPQTDAISAELTGSDSGILMYNDYRGVPCYYPYHAISGTNGWRYVAGVPVAATKESNVDYIFTLILLLFLGVLVALNGLWMRHLNTLLKSNVKHLDEARIAADAANDAKTFFLAHMSHEMRTPLNAIIGMGILAQDKANDPELVSLLDKMSSASEHLLGIINDVLDISKIGEGKLTLHNEPFSIEEMNRSLSAIYNISAGEKGISLVFDTDVEIGRYIIGDQMRLRQVITNLISNAIKYNRPGGFAKVAIRQVGESEGKVRICFLIEDNGFGISEDKQKEVFEPFTRDYTDNTKSIAGTGLGLAISYELVAAMGGDIKLESELGVGSKFYFTLDFQLGDVIVPKEGGDVPQWNAETLKGLRILVAEDNDVNAYIVENMLRRAGAQVVLVPNGLEAYEQVRDSSGEPFDVALMDVLMPIMDGYEATERIRALDDAVLSSIPIIALSANAFNENIETSLSHGMKAHLVKPIDMNVLYKTILDVTSGA